MIPIRSRCAAGLVWLMAVVLVGACGPTPDGTDAEAASPARGPDADRALTPAEQQRLEAAAAAQLEQRPTVVFARLGDLLDWDPPHPKVQIVAGHAAYDLGRHGEAAERLQDAADREPGFVGNASQLGFAYHKLGRHDDARAAFAATVTARPGAYKAHYGLGLVALEVGDDAAARTHLEQALEHSPRYLKARHAMARLLEQEGRLEQAAAEAEGVVRDWPSNEQAWYLLGRVLGRLGREQEAEQAMARRARVYAARERLNVILERIRTGDDEAGLHAELVRIYLDLGDGREAKRALTLALRSHPDDPTLRALASGGDVPQR